MIYGSDQQPVTRAIRHITINHDAISKGEFSHYMIKEIFEQPLTIQDTFAALLKLQTGEFENCLMQLDPTFERIRIVACGTSYYAGLVGKYWLEKWAKIPVDVEIASEFRYREPVIRGHCLNIVITQSGETIDTLSALQLIRGQGQKTLAIVNVLESSIARLADYVLPTMAGPEIGVASTKAFTAQLAVLASLCLYFAHHNKHITSQDMTAICDAIRTLPDLMRHVLAQDATYTHLALELCKAHYVLFLGRGIHYPIALEGALKLKEISYIHAEGYAAGELKHGPIALIESEIPVIVIAPSDAWFDKTLSNVQEIIARGARVTVITDAPGAAKLNAETTANQHVQSVSLPSCHAFLHPMLYTVPIQLLAYYTAQLKGTDVDQPRNLAKSVTVE